MATLDMHILWLTGWSGVLAGFAGGAALGLGFHGERFLGGYASWSRRLLRLGHIACIALGVLQMLVALSPAASASGTLATACVLLWVIGSITMPLTCALAAWRPVLRHAFAVPVVSLVCAAGITLALIVEGASS